MYAPTHCSELQLEWREKAQLQLAKLKSNNQLQQLQKSLIGKWGFDLSPPFLHSCSQHYSLNLKSNRLSKDSGVENFTLNSHMIKHTLTHNAIPLDSRRHERTFLNGNMTHMNNNIKYNLGLLSDSAGIIRPLKLWRTSDAGQSVSCN